MQIPNEVTEVTEVTEPTVEQVIVPKFVKSNSKRERNWLLTVEYQKGTNWINLQTVSVPKAKVSEVRARRLIDDMVQRYALVQPTVTFRGLLSSQVYAVAIAPYEVPDELPAQ